MLARILIQNSDIIANIISIIQRSGYVIVKNTGSTISITSAKKDIAPTQFAKEVDDLVSDLQAIDKDLIGYVPDPPTFFQRDKKQPL